MDQPDMFVTPHRRARRSDPVTSHEAAAVNEARLNAQAERVLSLITRFPGHTACELAKRATASVEAYVKLRYAISRRAAELRRDGLVRSGAPRQCTVAGSRQMVWYAS